MKTLHLYVLRQAVATLVMTLCVFVFVLLIGNLLREILAVLVNRQATLFVVAKALGLLLPWIMAYALPFALLTAMLLLFGRLSADNELTAVRASGISLLSLITPLLLFALLMSGVSAWFNLKVTPESRVAYKQLLLQLGLQNTESLITEDRFIDEIPNIILYVRKKRGDTLEDVCIYGVKNGEITTRTTASKGRVIWDRAGGKVTFELEDALFEAREERLIEIRQGPAALPYTSLFGTNVVSEITSNLGPGRLIGKSRVFDWHPLQGGETTIPVDLPKVGPPRATKLNEMSFAQLREELAKRKEQGVAVTPVLVQMHKQIAFSFASFAFTLVAIPLGVRAHRRETSIGMAISIILALIYYSFMILGEALQMRDKLNPHLLVWIPNVLFQTLGIALIWRANRQG